MSATRPPAFDDRFSTPIEASRRGAHRARPKPVSVGLPVAAGIAVVVLVLGGSYVMFKGGGGVSDANSNLAAASAVDDDPKSSASAPSSPLKTTAPATGKVAAPPDRPTPDQSATSEPSAASAASAGAKVNRDIRFKLLNSTAVAGLAKRVKANIAVDGWKVLDEDTGNSRNRGLAISKIYYGRASTKATAQALQQDLGFGTVVRDLTALTGSGLTSSDLAVVLGTDAQ
jgi:hypothetical protein